MRVGTDSNPIELLSFDDEQQEANGVAEHVAARLRNSAHPSDIVILARTTKLLERVQQALSKLSIESHIQRRKSQFESAPFRFLVSALKLALVRSDKDLAATVTKALSDCVKQEISSENLAEFSTVLNGDQLEALGVLVTTSNAVPQELCQAVQSLVQGQYAQFVQLTLSYFDAVEKESEDDGNEQYAEYEAERAVWQKILRDDMGGENDAYSLSLGQFL